MLDRLGECGDGQAKGIRRTISNSDNRPTTVTSLLHQIEKEGLTCTRDKRFYHARGQHNKGQAAAILAGLYRRLDPELVTVGIAERSSDLSLLQHVDVPILLRKRGQRWSDAIVELLERSAKSGGN